MKINAEYPKTPQLKSIIWKFLQKQFDNKIAIAVFAVMLDGISLVALEDGRKTKEFSC